MMLTYTRDFTDSVDVTLHGDVAAVIYTPGKASEFDAVQKFVVAAADVPSRRVKDPIKALLSARRFSVLTDRGAADFLAVPYEWADDYGRAWFEDDAVAAMPCELDRLIHFNAWDHTFYRFGDERPCSRPYDIGGIGLGSSKVNMEKATAILAAHPWVLSATINTPSPFSCYMSSTVKAVVLLPQDIHDKLHAHCSAPPAHGLSPGRVAEILTWAVPLPGETPTFPPAIPELGYDPLGLSPARVPEQPDDDYEDL